MDEFLFSYALGFCNVGCLASQQRCHFENTQTLRFEIAPPKIEAILHFFETLGLKGKKWEFAILNAAI